MDYNSDDFNIEEDGSETPSTSHHSIYTHPASPSLGNSNGFIQSSSSDFISEETYTKQLTDRVCELKAQLQTPCHLDWFRKFEPWEHNPKVELNLLLHGAIRERTLRQLALFRGIIFTNDEQIIAEIFQNDPCLLQRIFQEIVNDRRQQRIIYTEMLFRPDVFNFDNKTSRIKLQDVMETLIDCIRFFTSNDILNNGINTTMESDGISDKTTTTMKSSISRGITPLPVHIKIILSCNWNSVKSMTQFIRFARHYPQEIVGIDFYGEEDDCRKYWNDFYKYTNILRHYHIPYQASMNNYKDLQLIDDVIRGLGIERICEAYEIVLSAEYMENILIQHAVHLVICPISNAYVTTNHRTNHTLSETEKKEKYQSTNSLDNPTNQQESNETTSYNLMNYLQSELLNYSITSLSPREYQQNLSSIYKNLFENNENLFTCEHMQWLNENSVKSSFASQQLKTELINYIREHYTNCYKQTILLKQLQVTTNKWQEEMNEIIDKNAQTALEFAQKMHKEKILQRFNHQQEVQTKLFEEGEEENEDNQPE